MRTCLFVLGLGLDWQLGVLVVVVYISSNARLAVALRWHGLGVGVTYAEFLNITGRQRAGAV